jgi:glycosyltransferase involved in cell wall biosynthesis
MNVCMLIWNYWPGIEGGAERQCRKIVRALGQMNVSCTVVTNWQGLGFQRRERDAGGMIARLGHLSPLTNLAKRLKKHGRRHLPFLRESGSGEFTLAEEKPKKFYFLTPFMFMERLSFMVCARAFLRARKADFDVIHVHEAHWIAGFGARMGKILGIPVLVKEASLPVLMPITMEVPFRKKWDKWRMTPWYVAQTDAASKGLREAGIREDRIFVVPNGVEVPAEEASLAEKNVLYVGNLWQGERWKSFTVLFKAWRLIHDRVPDAKLIVVGGGDAQPWRDYITDMGISASVEFAGQLGVVDDCYRKAGVFVLPSIREGMSNALLESQSWGIPAVVSDIPGNRAVVKDGDNGIVVGVNDHEGLAQAVTKLLGDSVLRNAMGNAARRRMAGGFSIDSVAQQLVKVYGAISGRAGK